MIKMDMNMMQPASPTADQMLDSIERIAHSKSVVITGHHVKIFDMSCEQDVEEYDALFVKLFNDTKLSKCIVWTNEREKMVNSDGSTTWRRYVEWSDFEIAKGKE